MNSSWVEKVISNFFTSRVDLFGENSTYLNFETNKPNETSTGTIPSGFNSLQFHGKIVFKDAEGNTRKSTPLIMKVMPDTAADKFLSFAFTNEINFYAKAVPTFATLDSSIFSLFPKFYYGEVTSNGKDTKSAIIFEDLNASGYKLAEKLSFLDYDHLALMMRKLGQFHAFSYKAKSTLQRWFNCMVKSFQENNSCGLGGASREILLSWAQRGYDPLQKDIAYTPYIEILLEDIDAIYKQEIGKDEGNPASVMVHGDYIRGNVMFRYNENNIPDDLLMVDMATCTYGSPVIDMAKILYMNADQATRDIYWDRLIDEYYTALKNTFPENQVPSKSAILKEFVGKCTTTYLMATTFVPSMLALDNNSVHPDSVLQAFNKKFKGLEILEEVPEEVQMKLFASIGGERGTQALKDVLKDMIDRGFICRNSY